MTGALNIWFSNPEGAEKRGVLSTVQVDGAAAFVKLGQQHFFQSPMETSHPLWEHLGSLPLFCLYTSNTELYKRTTMGCDIKHVQKRVRERLKSETGMVVCDFKMTGSFLRTLLASSGTTPQDLDLMFATGYADSMNVPATIKFLKAVSKLGSMTPDDFGKRKVAVEANYQDIQLLSPITYLLWTIGANKEPSLNQRLSYVSELMHILFVCHRRNKTKFLANQTYTNLQQMLRSFYWSVVNCKVEEIRFYFIYQDSIDRLEEFYCMLRTLSGGATGNGDGMDFLQASERTCGCMRCECIFGRNPHLRKPSKHLSSTSPDGSSDHQNPKSFLLGPDGKSGIMNRIDVTSVNLKNRFVHGRDQAAQALKKAGFLNKDYDWDSITSSEDVDFLRPNGEFVGVAEENSEKTTPTPTPTPTHPTPTPPSSLAENNGVTLEEEIGAVPDEGGGAQSPLKMKKVTLPSGDFVGAARALRIGIFLFPVLVLVLLFHIIVHGFVHVFFILFFSLIMSLLLLLLL